jgi:DNA-binding transcriptional MerR regulator
VAPSASDGPEGKRYYRIGEVSQLTGVKPHVLRYWESEFRWMAPAKSRSKQRLYRRRDLEMIQLIKRLLYEERYTIAGARRKLREMGVARALEEAPAERRPDPRAELRRIQEELRAIRAAL